MTTQASETAVQAAATTPQSSPQCASQPLPRTATPGPCKVAVLIPCRNEAIPIAKVIRDFKAALPDATIYVYDNASTDSTAAVARRENAVVRFEPYPGKGNVIRRMFADIDADIYVMVDGDDTYDAALAPE